MEWVTTHHLDVGAVTQQPHHAAFHPTQALLAVAVGHHIHEYDVLMGCKLASIDVGVPAIKLAYSPAGGHSIIAVLEDWTIKSCDLDTEHTQVLYSLEKKLDKNIEVHIALTPFHPWLFFGFHRQMFVNIVGTIEGSKSVTKIKTDLRKPITDLACHPRSPLLYVAYLDGIVRAYNIQSFNVHYTLQIDSTINTIKLVGAGAIAFHSTLEWIFIGDRSGTLIAWDVSVSNHPTMIGITQVGSNAIPTVAWNPVLKLLITLTKEGNVQAWKTRVNSNPNRPPMKAQFFEPAGLEAFDVSNILRQQGGEAVYPLPRIKELLVHSKLNSATCILMSAGRTDEARSRGATLSREGRKQLFAVLQSARGSPGSVLKEKLAILGSAGILPDQQLQLQMQQSRGYSGQPQLTVADLARKAFLHSNLAEGKTKTGPILKLPLLTISDQKHMLRDIPVCQPIHQELRFFNSEQRIFDYPVRIFFMDSCNLTAYNLSSGEYNIYKKLSPTALGGNERVATRMMYSVKQHLFLIFFECRGATSEVMLYRDQVDMHTAIERVITITGCDGAFIGLQDNQYAILEDDGLGLSLFTLEDNAKAKSEAQSSEDAENSNALDVNTFSQANLRNSQDPFDQRPMSYVFYSPVQRIFSTPIESTLLYASQGGHIGLAKLSAESLGIANEVFEISTKPEDGPSLKLKPSETVLQVRWQEIPSGQVAGVLTSSRVMILSAKLEVLACCSTKFDNGFPSFRSLVWAGPALLFSSATTIAVLGWDGVARPLVTISTPNAALVGFLNDRVLLACPTDSNPRQKQGVEIRIRLVGLLEPLLVGWATLQKTVEPKLELAELMFHLTSRFDSLRVTPRLLDTLATGPTICGDLAVELALAGPQFTQVLRCQYATLARRFTSAISILKDEFLRSRDYPRCPPTSPLFQRFRELGRACIKFGQFDLAKETFEVIPDYESLLDLFICHLNPSALRRLSQKLEESGASPELQRQCAKILSVRSTSWGQGPLLANFAAESMLPKGPEWGGGNWEVKTPAQVRSVPAWELSNEVTAYMKTPNEPIPTIIPDHLGVYLGTLKGRGTVIEVKETALVKRLVTAQIKDSDLPPGLNLSILEKGKIADDASAKGAPRLGLQDLMRNTGGVSAQDEQAKAEQEFKKFGMDDSSDEEDDSTHKRKIKFVIKPAEGTAVDVNKVKVATQQLKLGPVGLLPPVERTRSGTQDLLSLTGGPPTPLMTTPGMMPGGLQAPPQMMPGGMQAPPHMLPGGLQVPPYMMPGGLQAPPYMMSGGFQAPPPQMIAMGVTAGPIPEDFFQNTASAISTLNSFQSAMANNPVGGFPPQAMPNASAQAPGAPGAHLMDGPSGAAGMPGTYGVPGTGMPGTYGLPGAGVPPQLGQAVPGGMDPFAGGVPPSGGTGVVDPFAGGVPPSGIENNLAQGASQPVGFPRADGSTDLNALSIPNSGVGVNEMGKAPPQPSSPPIVARPGQVPRGAPASRCFKAGIAHLEVNQLTDALSCLDEGFLALAKDQSLGQDIRAQATICAQYKLAVLLLQEISRLQRVQGANALSAKDEIARLARHLSTLPLWAKHRTMCIRTAIKRNMDVQNFAFAKSMLDLLLSKAPSNKQDELRSLINICIQRGASDKSVDPSEDPSQFCAATLGRLSTIGYDMCDICGSRFSMLSSPLCVVCGMGTVNRSDAVPKGATPSPFS